MEPHGLTAVVHFRFSATPRRSLSSFDKASEDTRCAFLHGFILRSRLLRRDRLPWLTA